MYKLSDLETLNILCDGIDTGVSAKQFIHEIFEGNSYDISYYENDIVYSIPGMDIVDYVNLIYSDCTKLMKRFSVDGRYIYDNDINYTFCRSKNSYVWAKMYSVDILTQAYVFYLCDSIPLNNYGTKINLGR